ncbi:MAG TPA: discoidin domain-containing protein, partial [Candidatus Nitrosocosmicus sp.]|nr:discoidin domain-containing protein [Candidatus Nitrosocosmicus sp.]
KNSSNKDFNAYFFIAPSKLLTADGTNAFHWAARYNTTDKTKEYYDVKAAAALTIDFNQLTKSVTHELIEACAQNDTDNKGYFIKAGSSLLNAHGPTQNELCDVCQTGQSNEQGVYMGITVAKYWSDQDGGCTFPPETANPTPWLTCHTNTQYNKTNQTCDPLPVTGGGGTTPPGTGGQGYKIIEAVASDDDGNVPGNAVDGKLDTRWSAFGKGQYLRADLGTAKKVNKVRIAWYQGDKRINHFEIKTAEVQGGAYTSQLIQDSQQGSHDFQDYTINPANPVRYIRVYVYGNSLNDWASISEIEIWGPDVPASTPGTGSGGDPGSGGTTPGGDTGGGTQTQPPPMTASYNFFDTSFSVDYEKIGLCNPTE